jgi:rubrerythrin
VHAVDKTRSIDFANLTLRDALDLARLVEEEAKERYGELADQMEIHHNPEVAGFFRFMIGVEGKHEAALAARRKDLFGAEPPTVTRAMLFDVEAPEYDVARATMTVRQALDAALVSERKAYAFFDAALAAVKHPTVLELFTELREDEQLHQELVLNEIAKLPAGAEIASEDDDNDDGPVAL